MPFVAVNGIQLYYEVHGRPLGEAETIVFAHGAGGSHLSWWQQVPAFTGDFTCVTFDHRGYGQSADVAEGPGGAAYVDDLEALLDHLHVGQANFVAQSMGGWSCLGFALRAPHRVRKLVMADTHGGMRSPEITAAARAARPAMPVGVHPAVGARMAAEQPALTFLYEQLDGLNRPRTREELGAIIAAAGSPDAELARALRMPVLFLAGDEDVVIPPAVVAETAKCVAGAQFELVPAAGHSVYFERAAAFNALVGRFLRD